MPDGRRGVLSHSSAHSIIRLRQACVPVPRDSEDEGGDRAANRQLRGEQRCQCHTRTAACRVNTSPSPQHAVWRSGNAIRRSAASAAVRGTTSSGRMRTRPTGRHRCPKRRAAHRATRPCRTTNQPHAAHALALHATLPATWLRAAENVQPPGCEAGCARGRVRRRSGRVKFAALALDGDEDGGMAGDG